MTEVPKPEIRVVHEGEWSVEDARYWIRLLNTLIQQRRALRYEHLYADLAVVMAAHHVSEYANAVLLVLDSEVPGTAYPLVRSAFESRRIWSIKSPARERIPTKSSAA